MRTGCYLFCLAKGSCLPRLTGTGLDGRSSLSILRYRDIAALYCPVRLDEFVGPEAIARMEDLTWLASRACRHEEVVEEALRHSPVLPVRFGTVFSSHRSLVRILQRDYRMIAGFLERLVFQEKWVVKGMFHKAQAHAGPIPEDPGKELDPISPAVSGKLLAFPLRRRPYSETGFNYWWEEACHQVMEELRGYAADFRRRRVWHDAVNGREMVVNAAFLLPRNVVQDFRTRLKIANARFASRGLAFEFSGPWPPYCFSPDLEPEMEPRLGPPASERPLRNNAICKNL